MRPWPTLQQAMLASDFQPKIDKILLEYDGPQIVLATLDGRLHLGIMSDEEGSLQRWIYSPVSHVELGAMAKALLTPHEALLKPDALVLDVDSNGAATCAWHTDTRELDDEYLPERGFVLPPEIAGQLNDYIPATSANLIAFDQLGAKAQPGLAFKVLSGALSALQKLWTALAADLAADETKTRGRWKLEIDNSSALRFASATAGSLLIEVRPQDGGTHTQVAKLFAAVVAARDGNDIHEVLRVCSPRTQQRFRDFLSFVERNELHCLLMSRDAEAFVAPSIAMTIFDALSPELVNQVEGFASYGYFTAFDSTRLTFEFADEDGDLVYKGDVDRKVVEENAAISVLEGGPRYVVLIESTVQSQYGAKPVTKYHLLKVQPTEGAVEPD